MRGRPQPTQTNRQEQPTGFGAAWAAVYGYAPKVVVIAAKRKKQAASQPSKYLRCSLIRDSTVLASNQSSEDVSGKPGGARRRAVRVMIDMYERCKCKARSSRLLDVALPQPELRRSNIRLRLERGERGRLGGTEESGEGGGKEGSEERGTPFIMRPLHHISSSSHCELGQKGSRHLS